MVVLIHPKIGTKIGVVEVLSPRKASNMQKANLPLTPNVIKPKLGLQHIP